jgi:PAS domain S-box-containing protein
MQTSVEKTSGVRERPDKNASGRLPLESRGRFPALKLVLTYAAVGTTWILFSDHLVSWLVHDPVTAGRVQTYKGWLFVAVTAVLLWFLAQRLLNLIRRSEIVLQESQNRLAGVISSAMDGIITVDEQQRITLFNAAAEKMFRCSAEQVLGQPLDRLIPERLDAATAGPIRASGQADTARRPMDSPGIVRGLRPGGEEFPIEASISQNESAGQKSFTVILRDITDRKQAEALVNGQKQVLEMIADGTPLGYTLETLLRHIETQSSEMLCSILLLDPDGVHLRNGGAPTLPPEYVQALDGLAIGPGVGSCGTAAFRREPVFVENIAGNPLWADYRELALSHGLRACWSTPIFDAQRNVLGTFAVYYREEKLPSEQHMRLIDVATHTAAICISRHRAEAALRESERNYREVFNATADAIFIHDTATGRIVQVNGAMLRMFGFASEEEILALNVGDLSANEPAFTEAEADIHFRKTLVEGPQVFEWRAKRKSGELFWVEVSLRASLIGGQGCVLAAVRDITERKRAEDVIRESELRLRTVVQNAPAIIFIVDLDGVFRLSEGQALGKLGLAPGEAVGKSALEMYKDMPSVLDSLRKALSGEPARAINILPGVVFDTVYSPIFDRDGKPAGLIGIAIDITDRKRAEEAQTLLATAVEQAAEAIVITDASGIISYVNPVFEKITGFTREEVIGRNPRMLRSGKHDAAFYRQMWETISRGQVWTSRIINKKKSGSLYEEEIVISPVLDSAGKIANYVAVKRDVTQEVALETQLRQAQKMEAIGQLAGGVAHDFNNILTVIQGSASLLLNPQLKPAERSDCSHQIFRAAERAAGLIRQLLLFSRKQVMQPANVDLNEVVGGMAKMLKRILGEDIALQTHYAPKLALIHADSGMIEQVLLNLVVNSRDAMPAGGGLTIATGTETLNEIQAQQNPDAFPGTHVWLTITDTGSGIAPEHLPHIFEPFFTTKEVGKGTGLGLATVYGIVKQHRGWINVTSEIGKGTTFRINFRALDEARAKEQPTPLRLQLPRGSETLLVVEDDVPVRLLVCNLLQRCGYTVLQAGSGKDALSTWKEHCDQIHLVFTDLVMPDGMTGRQLAEQLQSEKPGLKIIYTSGYSTEVGKGLPLIEGVNFLQKPYPSGKLAQTVRNCLNQK